MFLTPISQPNFITVRFLKVSSPGSSTLLKHELSTCLLSWSTSGCPCSVRIISFTRFVNLIFTNLIQGYESLLIRLTVSLCSSRTITAKTSLLRQWSTICSRLNVLEICCWPIFLPVFSGGYETGHDPDITSDQASSACWLAQGTASTLEQLIMNLFRLCLQLVVRLPRL